MLDKNGVKYNLLNNKELREKREKREREREKNKIIMVEVAFIIAMIIINFI